MKTPDPPDLDSYVRVDAAYWSAQPAPPREYVLRLRDTGDSESRYRRLRAALKHLLRACGYQCTHIEPSICTEDSSE